MPDRIGEFHDGDIVEVASGDRFVDCQFLDCELAGEGGATFVGCVFEGSPVILPGFCSFINCFMCPSRGIINA